LHLSTSSLIQSEPNSILFLFYLCLLSLCGIAEIGSLLVTRLHPDMDDPVTRPHPDMDDPVTDTYPSVTRAHLDMDDPDQRLTLMTRLTR